MFKNVTFHDHSLPYRVHTYHEASPFSIPYVSVTLSPYFHDDVPNESTHISSPT